MSFDVEQHVRYRIANASVNPYPFAHFYVENVFPPEFYARLLDELPDTGGYAPINETGTVSGGAYDERYVCDLEKLAADHPQSPVWPSIASWMMRPAFSEFIVRKFQGAIAERFGKGHKLVLSTECRLVRDFTNYAIAPHTDSGRKLVSLLFYLPPDASTRHLGTSIYLPKDPGFVSDGSEHLRPDAFLHVARMDYVPNALFAFVRTDFSFHGVEPIADRAVERDLMLYNVYAPKVIAPPAGAKA